MVAVRIFSALSVHERMTTEISDRRTDITQHVQLRSRQQPPAAVAARVSARLILLGLTRLNNPIRDILREWEREGKRDKRVSWHFRGIPLLDDFAQQASNCYYV